MSPAEVDYLLLRQPGLLAEFRYEQMRVFCRFAHQPGITQADMDAAAMAAAEVLIIADLHAQNSRLRFDR